MKSIANLALALAILGASAAVAQEDRRDQDAQDQRPAVQGAQDQRQGLPSQDNSHPQAQQHSPERDVPHWSRGDRLPEEYRSDQNVVSDWQAHKLRKPPQGYHWVRADNRYVLASITSGVIAAIFLGQ